MCYHKVICIYFQLGEWKAFLNNGFTFKVLPLTFPADNPLEWKKLFKPCAAQRLFLPVSVQTSVEIATRKNI